MQEPIVLQRCGAPNKFDCAPHGTVIVNNRGQKWVQTNRNEEEEPVWLEISDDQKTIGRAVGS